MQNNNNNGVPIGVTRVNHYARPNLGAGAGAGAGVFGAGLFGVGAGGAGVVPAGAGAGAGGFGGVPAGAGLGAGGFPAGLGAGAGAGAGAVPPGLGAGVGVGTGAGAQGNQDREQTPPTFPIGGGGNVNTPPHTVFIAQPQVAVQQTAAANQAHLVNGIDTPPPSPNR